MTNDHEKNRNSGYSSWKMIVSLGPWPKKHMIRRPHTHARHFSVIYGTLKFIVDKIVSQKGIRSSLTKVKIEPGLSTIVCRFCTHANKTGLVLRGQKWIASEAGRGGVWLH